MRGARLPVDGAIFLISLNQSYLNPLGIDNTHIYAIKKDIMSHMAMTSYPSENSWHYASNFQLVTTGSIIPHETLAYPYGTCDL